MKFFFNIISLFIIIISATSFLFDIKFGSIIYIILTIIQTAIFVSYGIINKPEIFKNWICPIYVLLFSLLVVNFQTLTNVSLGFGSLGDYMFGGDYYDYLIKPCLALSVVSMSCFMITVANYNDKQTVSIENRYYNEKLTNILLFVSFLYFIATIDIMSFISGSVYIGTGASDAGVQSYGYSERFLDSMIYISLAIYSYNMKKECNITNLNDYIKRIPIVFWFVYCSYLILRLMSGDRGPVMYITFAIVYSCMYCCRLKIKLYKVALIGIGSVVLMASISFARLQTEKMSFYEKIKMGSEMVSLTDVPNISPFTQELAGSNICTLIMMNDIYNGKIPYQYGTNIISVLTNSIPGMGIVKSKLSLPDFVYIPASTTYITMSAYGGKDFDSGYGSTLIADYFYDFGFYGCIGGFIFLGYLFSKITYSVIKSKQMTVISLIFVLKMASLSLYMPRSTMWASIGSVIFILVIFYILRPIISRPIH